MTDKTYLGFIIEETYDGDNDFDWVGVFPDYGTAKNAVGKFREKFEESEDYASYAHMWGWVIEFNNGGKYVKRNLICTG